MYNVMLKLYNWHNDTKSQKIRAYPADRLIAFYHQAPDPAEQKLSFLVRSGVIVTSVELPRSACLEWGWNFAYRGRTRTGI